MSEQRPGIGECHFRTSAFESDAARKQAWFDHREELLVRVDERPGWRPWGFWEYEGPPELRDHDALEAAAGEDWIRELMDAGEGLEAARLAYLRRNGLLRPGESEALAERERERDRHRIGAP